MKSVKYIVNVIEQNVKFKKTFLSFLAKSVQVIGKNFQR